MANRVSLEQIPRIEPQELKSKLDRGEDVVVVDVRRMETYEEGHLPGALSIPLAAIIRQPDVVPRGREVALY